MSKRPWITIAAACMLAASIGGAWEPAPAQAQTAAALSQGMSSTAVSQLQQNLKTLGYFTYPTATGYFGTITAQAVKDFQKAYSLTVTGSADSATQTAIAHALTKRAMMADAMNYLRIPYQWGGSSPTTGFDCSGFIYFMLRAHGIEAVRTTSSVLSTMGTAVPRSALRPGDLVFFGIGTPGVVDHVGFYMGNNQFLSATRSAGIYPQSMDSSYWGPKYLGAKRIY